MRVGVAGDHAGFESKNFAAEVLRGLGHDVVDYGPASYDPTDDYPDFVFRLADAVAAGEVERGVLACGSGVGASVAANKVSGVRAAVCHDTYSAHQGVEHDDMNVLCVGGRVVGAEVERELITAFMSAAFTGEERHVRRLNKVLDRERNAPSGLSPSGGD